MNGAEVLKNINMPCKVVTILTSQSFCICFHGSNGTNMNDLLNLEILERFLLIMLFVLFQRNNLRMEVKQKETIRGEYFFVCVCVYLYL